MPLDATETEIIIVNDGSTDETKNVIMDLAADPRIKAYNMPINKGPGSARNIALDLAAGEYVLILDADDYIYKEEYVKALEFLNGIDLIYYNLKINNGNIWRLNEQTKKIFCGATKFIRRDFIGTIRYPENIKIAEDYYFYMNLLKNNPSELFTDLAVVHYNHPRKGSLTAG